MRFDDPHYLLTVRMNCLEHWPFMMFFKRLPTLEEVLPLLGNQPLPYSMASTVRDRAIELVKSHGLPVFEDRFPASRVILSEGREDVGMVEVRKIRVYDNRPEDNSDFEQMA